MELTNQQTLPVSQAQAWEALNDIALLQSAIPGCDGLTAIGDNLYEVLITAAITGYAAMLVFGMINWTFTWLKPGGAMSYAEFAEWVIRMLEGGIGNLVQPVAAQDAARAAAAPASARRS